MFPQSPTSVITHPSTVHQLIQVAGSLKDFDIVSET